MAYPESARFSVITVPHSFETGEQCAIKIYFPHTATLVRVRSTVVKAIAASNDGTITVADVAGTITTITHTASEALGTEKNIAVRKSIARGGYVQLTSAKTTAGGKVIVSLEVDKGSD